MSSREAINSAISRFGRSVLILRDPLNLTEKHMIVQAYGAQIAKSPFPQEMSYFVWNSGVRNGDICQDVLSAERKLIMAIDFLGTNGQKGGLRVVGLKCNDTIILYELVPSATPVNAFGKRNYADTVRVNDYACVFHNVQGDSLVPLGELGKSEVVIVFSGRKLLAGYVPKQGDRLVTLDGTKYQVDGVDSHVYPGSFKCICTPDQRTE